MHLCTYLLSNHYRFKAMIEDVTGQCYAIMKVDDFKHLLTTL